METLAVVFVGNAHPDDLQLVEDVQLGYGQLGQRVDPDGIAEHDRIQPSRDDDDGRCWFRTRVRRRPGGHPHHRTARWGTVRLPPSSRRPWRCRSPGRCPGGRSPHRCMHRRRPGLMTSRTDRCRGPGSRKVAWAPSMRILPPASNSSWTRPMASVMWGMEPWSTGTQVLVSHLVGIDRKSVEDTGQDLVGVFQRRPQLLTEDLLVEEVLYPDAHPHGPVGHTPDRCPSWWYPACSFPGGVRAGRPVPGGRGG